MTAESRPSGEPLINALAARRFVKFALVGGSAFAIDFIIYFFLTRFVHLPFILSRTISIGVAMFWNFFMNRTWTFRAQSGKVSRQASRFVVVMTATSLLNLLLMRVGVSTLGFNDIVVMVVVSLLITLVNFFSHLLWSYKER